MKDLSNQAKVFILVMISIGVLLSVYTLARLDRLSYGLLILAGLATLAQIFKVEGSTHKSSYSIGWLIYGFTFMLMGVPATLFVILVAHLVEWAWHKYPWYLQLFNMANYAIAVTAAGVICGLIDPAHISLSFISVIAYLAALATFTFVNHALVGLVIWLARGQNFSQSGVFGFLTVMIDFSLIGLGAATALIWGISPYAIVFSLIPIYMIYSTLRVPALQRQTEIDPKTKLYNARYFAEALNKELDRAVRFNRPLTVVLGDLDLLRNINNTYGHLAGDVVLVGVAEILQNNFRGYDLVARFGGEEFAILMPETTPEEAYQRIEDVRMAVEAAEFNISTSVTPIQVTISFGVSGLIGKVKTAEELIHDADVTLYHAKLVGRNITCTYSEEGIKEFFGNNGQNITKTDENAIKSRLGSSPSTFQPNPLREKAIEKSIQPEKPNNTKKSIKRHPKHLWWVDVYIGSVALVAIGLVGLTLWLDMTMNWYGLIIFSLLILFTEGLAIDIYVRETSISTAAAPLIAGSLLFGPQGALVLSLVLAATAMIKHRSKINRFIFNSSNHFISSSLGAFLVILSSYSLVHQPAYVQIAFAVLSGIIVFFSSTLLLSGVMSLSMNQTFSKVWGERFRWLLPYYLAFGVAGYALILGYNTAGIFGLVAVILPLLTLRVSHVQYIDNTKSMVSQLRTQNQELEDQGNKIANLNEDLLLSLANVIDLRDTDTMGHSKGVAQYAALLSKKLGLSPEQIEQIQKTGLLHDIGKIGIPDSILLKPDRLTPEEFEIIKEHPVRGAEIVGANHTLVKLAPIIRHHHERYDGMGYPDGLHGKEIPLGARILGLADAVQAMASDRPYRRALCLSEIISEVRRHTGTQFDPSVVEAFLDCIPEVEAMIFAAPTPIQSVKEPALVEIRPTTERHRTELISPKIAHGAD